MMKQGVLDTPMSMTGPVNPVPPPPMLAQAVGQQAAYLPTGVYHFQTRAGGRVVECTLHVGIASISGQGHGDPLGNVREMPWDVGPKQNE